MKFLDSTYGRTLTIALIAFVGTVFASDWSNGSQDVIRAAGGAFVGALTPLVVYLQMNSKASPPATPVDNQPGGRLADNPDDDFHFGWRDGKEHRGPTPDACNICQLAPG